MAKKLSRLKADADSTMAALEARKPSKTALYKRPAMLKTLNKAQLEMVAEEEKGHDIVMARAHSLIKDDYYQWIARNIKTVQSRAFDAGRKERARTMLQNLGINRSQYDWYLRKAEREEKQQRHKKRLVFRKKAG